jgi:hypothetical protein
MTANVHHNPPANSRTPSARELVAAKNVQAPLSQAASTALVPATPDNRSDRSKYLDEVAPATIVGRRVKFSKDGRFITSDDDQEIPEAAEFIALCPQTLVGYIRFNGPGEPPDSVMGLLYGDDFTMPPRESLADLDQAKWELGLNGKPNDPWGHHMYLVLQDTATSELYTFDTASNTGRRAVGNLLRHYDRMQRTHPDELPVIRLRAGGFQHKDDRVGFVKTPVFVVCGRTPSDSAARPDTSTATFLDDVVPF